MRKGPGGERRRGIPAPAETEPHIFSAPPERIVYYPESLPGCKAQPGDLVQLRDDSKPWRFMGRVGENAGRALLVDEVTREHRLIHPTLLKRATVVHEGGGK